MVCHRVMPETAVQCMDIDTVTIQRSGVNR